MVWCWCCYRFRLQFWLVQTGEILAPAGKRWSQSRYSQTIPPFLKEADKLDLAEVYSVAVLNCHIPVAERSQWRRFWRLKEFLEKTQMLCPACHKLLRLCLGCCHLDTISCSRNAADSSPPKPTKALRTTWLHTLQRVALAEFNNVSTSHPGLVLFTCYSGSWGSEFVYSTGRVIFVSCYNMDTWTRH